MADAHEESTDRRGLSVRTRILASILAVAIVGLAVAGATAYFTQRDRILTGIDERLEQRVEAARAVVTGEVPARDGDDSLPAAATEDRPADTRSAVSAVLQRIVPGEHESALGVIDERASLLPPTEIDFHLEESPELVARIVREVSDGSVRIGTSVGALGHIRYIAAPIEVAGDPQQGVYIAAFDIDEELDDLDAAFVTYFWVALAASAAIGLVGWFVAGRLLRPIRRVSEAASRITVSDLSERIPVRGNDDVSQLTVTVNGMFDRLDSAISGQRRLLDDVRHELKTPITIVRGHLELLDTRDPDEVAATRDLALGELDRMTELVDDIELLAELPDEGLRTAPTDITSLTAEVHRKASGIAGHTWLLAESAPVVTEIDARRITQAWLQLVDNAAKYSPEDSPIRIGSTRRDDTVECWVEDEGEGIPAGAEARIFERFGRVDTGRGIRGSGLGLPIVKAIAESHGGRVSLSSSTAGSRFGIVLPLAPDTTREEVDA
ncbi:MAG: HAMP domain-containing sensor histidine kinase [Microbacteriaceae bacterium]